MPADARRDVVNLRVGDEHPVRLKGLATAGYRWVPALEGDDGIAAVDEAGVAELPNRRIGTSADELFTIRALRPGAAVVRFAQRRPFESKDVPPVEEHVFEVRVT